MNNISNLTEYLPDENRHDQIVIIFTALALGLMILTTIFGINLLKLRQNWVTNESQFSKSSQKMTIGAKREEVLQFCQSLFYYRVFHQKI